MKSHLLGQQLVSRAYGFFPLPNLSLPLVLLPPNSLTRRGAEERGARRARAEQQVRVQAAVRVLCSVAE